MNQVAPPALLSQVQPAAQPTGQPTFAELAAAAAHLQQQKDDGWTRPLSKKQKQYNRRQKYEKTKCSRELIMHGLENPEGQTQEEKNKNEHASVIKLLNGVLPGMNNPAGALWSHRRHWSSETNPKPITLIFRKDRDGIVDEIKKALAGVQQTTLRPSLTPEERKRKKAATEGWKKLPQERRDYDGDTAWRCPAF